MNIAYELQWGEMHSTSMIIASHFNDLKISITNDLNQIPRSQTPMEREANQRGKQHQPACEGT